MGAQADQRLYRRRSGRDRTDVRDRLPARRRRRHPIERLLIESVMAIETAFISLEHECRSGFGQNAFYNDDKIAVGRRNRADRRSLRSTRGCEGYAKYRHWQGAVPPESSARAMFPSMRTGGEDI